MPHTATIVIAWYLIVVAPLDVGADSDGNTQATEVQNSDVRLPTLKDQRRMHVTLADKESYHEQEAALQSFDHPDRSGPQSVRLAQLETDERFWRTYRDYETDADSILAWKDFQAELAGRK